MKNVTLITMSPEELNKLVNDTVITTLTEFKKSLSLSPQSEETVYLSRADVAKMLGVDESTVSNWKNAKKLQAYSFPGSGRVWYKKNEVEQAIVKL